MRMILLEQLWGILEDSDVILEHSGRLFEHFQGLLEDPVTILEILATYGKRLYGIITIQSHFLYFIYFSTNS